VTLTLEGEVGANLVATLIELLGIEGAANAKGEASIDLGVVGQGDETTVIDLELFSPFVSVATSKKITLSIPWQS
jgi:hypothetical protein